MSNRSNIAVLLATTMLSCAGASGARAQTAPASTPRTTATDAPAAKPAVETVEVVGRSSRERTPGGGLMRVETAAKTVETVTHDFIAKQSPTTNAQQLLRMLPSANVSDVDPFGLYSGQSTVRGLNSSQMGWLLDGAPLNDIGGGQFYANEVLEAEDLDSVSLLPGSVNIDSPTVNASGGLVQMTMSNPTKKAGGLLDVSFGSDKLNREFLRLNSGEIGNSGIRAMIGFSHTHANNWRGPGGAEKSHLDFKAVKDFEGGSRTSLTVSYNNQTNDSFLFPTEAQYKQYGNSYNYDATYLGVANNGKTIDGRTINVANYYKLHVNPFENVVTSAPSTLVVNSRLSVDDTPYFWHGIGNGTGASLLTEGSTYEGNQKVGLDLNGDGKISSATKVLTLTPSNQEQFRPGNTIKATYNLDSHNALTGGWWYEYSNELQYSPVGYVDQQNGQAANNWGVQSIYTLPNGGKYEYRNFLTLSQVNMLFLNDTAKYFDDRLTLNVGFKEAMIRRSTYNYVPGGTYNRNLSSQAPLPQIAISWQPNSRSQFYVSGATNFRTPSNTSLIDYYSNTTGALSQQGGSSKSEYSISEEVGYRYNGDLMIGSISFFNYNFTNRQLSLNSTVNGGATYSQTVNAGGQTSRGVDIQLSTRPIIYHLRPYATFEYLDARIDNNLQTSSVLNGKSIVDYLPTAGKTQIMSPKTQAGIGLDYDDGTFFASVDVKYVGSQYSTFMNDEKMPGFVTDNVAMGYRFHRFNVLKAPQIQLNLSNLTGDIERTGVYSFSNNAQTTKGVFGGKVSGTAPTYYLQPSFAAIVTVSSAF